MYVTFPEAIKEIRANRKFSQEDLARELGVSFSTVNRWERGHTKPTRLAKRVLLDFCYTNQMDSSISDVIRDA
jgi:DNA-binding transcriptional regulator YiaG